MKHDPPTNTLCTLCVHCHEAINFWICYRNEIRIDDNSSTCPFLETEGQNNNN
jgi:hypothetical protein